MNKNAASRRVYHYGDVALGVEEMGQEGGRCFVLVHGIGASSRYFMPLARELSKKAKVYVLDLPGFGPMPKPPRTLSIADYAALVDEFITSQEIQSPILVGNSMGCQILIEMLIQKPSISKKMVLIGPVVNQKERSIFRQALRLFQDSFHEPPYVNWMIVSDYIRCGPRWYFKTLPAMRDYPIEEKIASVQAEIVIVRGVKDPIAPHDWATELCRRASRARLSEIPHIGHVAMYKRAPQVAQECLER